MKVQAITAGALTATLLLTGCTISQHDTIPTSAPTPGVGVDELRPAQVSNLQPRDDTTGELYNIAEFGTITVPDGTVVEPSDRGTAYRLPEAHHDPTRLPAIEVAVARGETSGVYTQTFANAKARSVDPRISNYTRARTTWDGNEGVVVTWDEQVAMEDGSTTDVQGVDIMIQVEPGTIVRVSGYARAGEIDPVVDVVTTLRLRS